VIHLSQNGMEFGYLAITTGWQTDKVIPGLQIAPKASKDILDAELGKPYMLL
jgi:hypothetical protein